MVTDGLNVLNKKAKKCKMTQGLNASKTISIRNLQCANDTIISETRSTPSNNNQMDY